MFERSERGGVAECQSCGGADQELLLVLFLDGAHPHSFLLVTVKNNLVLLLNWLYTIASFSVFQAITAVCLARVIRRSAALGCFIFSV